MTLNNVGQSSSGQGFNNCISQKVILIPDIPISILEANDNRAYVSIVSNSNSSITLVFGESNTASLNTGIILMGKGSSYEITQGNLYLGEISAISSNTAELSVVSCEA